jgi:hypothetical protein
MRQFGSGRSIIAQNQSAVADSNGNLIVSPDDSWTGSPLGIGARNQVAIGVPNGTFNILPADPVEEINAGNPLPYWDWAPDDGFIAKMAYDTATQTNSVNIDPTGVGTALGTAVLRTRIPITNDEGLSVRQYVSSSLIQTTKTGSGSRWTATLTSQYYDTTGAALGTPYIIGTFLERNIVTTNLAGYTNASGAIPASAAELEIEYTVVVGTAAPDYLLQIKSVMVATEYGAIGGGGGGTVIPGYDYQEFLDSGTFTVPTGIEYVNVWAMGGGAGGNSGEVTSSNATTSSAQGGTGGRTAWWVLRRDIYVGNVASVSVGIGAGGAGGTAITFSKAAGATTQKNTNPADTNAGSAGNTTFGTYFTALGANQAGDSYSGWYGVEHISGTTGGGGGNPNGSAGAIGTAHPLDSYGGAPFVYAARDFAVGGDDGVTGVASGGTGQVGVSGKNSATTGLAGGGGGGGSGSARSSGGGLAGAGGDGGPGGGGGGGGAVSRYINAGSLTITGTAGNGGNGDQITNGGCGGGGGAGIAISASGTANYASATITAKSGAGGRGGDGRLYVYWLKDTNAV